MEIIEYDQNTGVIQGTRSVSSANNLEDVIAIIYGQRGLPDGCAALYHPGGDTSGKIVDVAADPPVLIDDPAP